MAPAERMAQGSGTVTAPGLTPVPRSAAPPLMNAPGAALGPPAFDPYSNAPGGAANPPSLLTPPSGAPYYDYGSGSPGLSPGFTPGPSPGFGGAVGSGLGPNDTIVPTEPYGEPAYPPAQPGYVFPNGVGQWGDFDMAPWLGQPEPGRYVRVFQDLRMRHTWITGGDDPTDLQIHDFEIGTTLNYPNFLFSQIPLQVSPGFILHLWDGPKTLRADLPPNAYSAFLNFGWQPQLTPQIGAILNVRVGVFSDFQTFTDDSVRILGQGLFVLGLTPNLALKGGVEYLDRVRVKLLPAGGLLWTPNERTRLDIYFPRPKFSRQAFVLGNRTVWWYLGAEYGGGSWTIERTARRRFRTDQVDINDIRAFVGLEWIDHFGLAGFVEAGFVFERELVYRFHRTDDLDLNEAFMLRAGFSL